MKILFLGHFSNSNSVHSGASAAGDVVQRKIVRSLEGISNAEVRSISQPTAQSWPKGKFFFVKSRDSYSVFPGLVNVAFLRDFLFGFSCFCHIIRFKPDNVIQYNSYLFVNVFVLLASMFLKFRKVMIIQDYRSGPQFKLISRLHDKIAGTLVRFYSFSVPVTEALARELKLQKCRFAIFPGAMEFDGSFNGERDLGQVSEVGGLTLVYAGALEKHNGVDKLIRIWKSMPENHKLMIFGKGSLEGKVVVADREMVNITYCGFASKDYVHERMVSADFNICFRFGDGIDERFFFPSKFFSVNCYPGFALINDFYGLPDGFRELGYLMKDDLSNLSEIINLDRSVLNEQTKKRQEYLYSNYRWPVFLREILFSD